MNGVPVQVDIDAPGRGQQVLQQFQPSPQHGQETVQALAPRVLVGQYLDEGRLLRDLHALVVVDLDIDGVIGAEVTVHHKRRVDVNQVHLVPVAVLPRLRVPLVQQGLESDQVVVGPDEPVRGQDVDAACPRPCHFGKFETAFEGPVHRAPGTHDLDDLGRDGGH